MTAPTPHEAVVIILDVGRTMATRTRANLEDAKQAVMLLVQNKMLYCKGDEVGVVLMGTKDTNNSLARQFENQYQNISVFNPIDIPHVNFLKRLNGVACEGYNSDWLDAVVVSCSMLHDRVKSGKMGKRVFLVTDAAQVVKQKEDLEKVLVSIKSNNITLYTIGIDFGEEPTDEEGEDWSNMNPKRQNEHVLYYICRECKGIVIPVTSALQTLSAMRSKTVLQRTSFRDNLYISDEVAIPLWGYVKTMKQNIPAMKKASGKAMEVDKSGDTDAKTETRYYAVDDPDKEIDASNKIKAYKYGRSIVPFSKVDSELLKFQSVRGMKLIAFSKAQFIPRKHFMGQTYVFVPPPGDLQAASAVSSLVRALFEMQRVAIVRYVRCKNGEPQLGVLLPVIKPEKEYFLYCSLPFIEDMRSWTFPSLPLATKIPREQKDAVGSLIDSMNLMSADKTESEEGEEALKINKTFNPCLQHFYQSLKERSLNPSAPVPLLSRDVARYSLSWEENGILREMLDHAKPAIQKVKDLFPLEPVEKDTKEKRKYWFAADNVNINLDSYKAVPKGIDEYDEVEVGEPPLKKAKGDYFNEGQSFNSASTPLSHSLDKPRVELSGSRTTSVGLVNPVGDFTAMINCRDMDLVESAIQGMQAVIKQLLTDSIGDQYYSKVESCLSTLRYGCVRELEPNSFNSFLRKMKESYSKGRRQDFWESHVVRKNITLIHSGEVEDSTVTPEESKEFLRTAVAEVEETHIAAVREEDDLFGEIE